MHWLAGMDLDSQTADERVMQIFAQEGFERLRCAGEAYYTAISHDLEPSPIPMPKGTWLRITTLGDGALLWQEKDDHVQHVLAAWVLLPSMDRPAAIPVDLIGAGMWRIMSSPEVLKARLRKANWPEATIERMTDKESLLGCALSGRRTPNEAEACAIESLFAEHA